MICRDSKITSRPVRVETIQCLRTDIRHIHAFRYRGRHVEKLRKKTNSHRGRQRQTERPLNSQIYTHKQAGVSRQTFSHRQTERQPLGYVDRRADIQAYVLRQIHRQPISQTY